MSRLFGVLSGVGVVLLVLAFPSSSPAQTPPAAAAVGYAGAEVCKACHANQLESFSATTMGKLFLRSEEHTSELQSQSNLVCRLLLEKKKKKETTTNADDTHSDHQRRD